MFNRIQLCFLPLWRLCYADDPIVPTCGPLAASDRCRACREVPRRADTLWIRDTVVTLDVTLRGDTPFHRSSGPWGSSDLRGEGGDFVGRFRLRILPDAEICRRDAACVKGNSQKHIEPCALPVIEDIRSAFRFRYCDTVIHAVIHTVTLSARFTIQDSW